MERASGDFVELLGLVGTPLAEVEAQILHNAVNPGPDEGIDEKNIIRVRTPLNLRKESNNLHLYT